MSNESTQWGDFKINPFAVLWNPEIGPQLPEVR